MTPKAYVYGLLTGDSALVALVATGDSGEPLISHEWYDELMDTIQVTILAGLEFAGFDYDNAEDLPVTPFVVNVWASKNQTPTPAVERIRTILKDNGIKSRPQDFHEDSLHRVQIVFEVDHSTIP